MMIWNLLTKESLRKLKKRGLYFLVYTSKYFGGEPFDLVHFLDLKGCGLPKEEMKQHWANTSDPQYELNDFELLEIYDYYYIIEQPIKITELRKKDIPKP